MAINSTKTVNLSNRSFSYQELITLLPASANGGIYNYINSAISQGLSKNEILSAARYISYIQGLGWSTYVLNNITYAIKTYTSTGNFDPSPFGGSQVEVLLVAGGGGGGIHNIGGGGGAGGLVFRDNFTLPTSSTTVTIGSGGAIRTNGTNSVFYSLTANGGGSGNLIEANGTSVGQAGGSGGGPGYNSSGGPATQPNSLTGGFGNAGGSGAPQTGIHSVGGGGGAGFAGQNGDNGIGRGGNGGNGLSYNISGTVNHYAGGGGGGSWSGGGQSFGGTGGGGNGNGLGGGVSTDGQTNTGGGGGGGASVNQSKPGGSGICIIREQVIFPASFGA